MSDTRPLRLVPPPVPVLHEGWGARLYRGRHRLVVPYEFRAGAMGLLVMCSLVASLSVLQIAHGPGLPVAPAPVVAVDPVGSAAPSGSALLP